MGWWDDPLGTTSNWLNSTEFLPSAQPPQTPNAARTAIEATQSARDRAVGPGGDLRADYGDLSPYIDPDVLKGYGAIEEMTRRRIKESMTGPQLTNAEKIGGVLQNIGGVMSHAYGDPRGGQAMLQNNYLTQHQQANQKHREQMNQVNGQLAMKTMENFDQYYGKDLDARRKLKLEAQREVQARREMGLPVSPQLYQAAGMRPDTAPAAPQQAPQSAPQPPPAGPPQAGPPAPSAGVPTPFQQYGMAPMPPQETGSAPPPEPAPIQTGSAPPQAPAAPGNPEAQQVLMEAELASRLGHNERATMLMKKYEAMTGGARTEADEMAKVAAREKAARTFGLDPETPEGRAFILTGKMPREDQQPLTATDKRAILEADEMVMSTEAALAAIKEAKALSPKAYEGFAASTRATINNNLPYTDKQASEATVNYDNAVIGQAVTQLKAIFGGMPTEGERKILIELQGSSSLPHNVRLKILERAEKLAERRLQMNKDRVDQLRGGTFYKPQEPRTAAPERTSTDSTTETAAPPTQAKKKNEFVDDSGGKWTLID